MKLYRILSLFSIVVFFSVFQANAVTDKEMDQARAIAAKAYLRYANNGSGYLDEQNPSSMAELKKVLKQKEVENLKTFEAVAVPKDYSSWDKAKLVEYWSATFFSSPGLIKQGLGAKSSVKKKVGAMTVAAPSATPSAAKNEKEEPKAATEEKKSEEEAAQPAVAMDGTGEVVAGDASSEMARLEQEADSIAAIANSDAGVDAEPRKKSSGTWVYVAILCVLVAVVVWLVIYASRLNKENPEKQKEDYYSKSPEPAKEERTALVDAAGAASAREEFAASLAKKNEEIRRLGRELETVGSECRRLEDDMQRLEDENGALKAENLRLKEDLRRKSELLEEERRAAQAAVTAARAVADFDDDDADVAPRETPVARNIFLGRVNAKGLFVRADRNLNPDGSVYRLETTDNINGTFRVVNVAEVNARLLDNPSQWLAGGCTGRDLLDTADRSHVVTDSPGNAIFESGCWRVIRKARVHYE